MKPTLSLRLRSLVFTALLTTPLITFSPALRAQDPPPAEAHEAAPAGEHSEHRRDINIVDATAEDVAAFLEKTSPTPLSIIIVGDGNVPMPSMKLKNVTAEEFFLLINQLGGLAEQASAGAFSYNVTPVDGVSGVYIFQITGTPKSRNAAPKPQDPFKEGHQPAEGGASTGTGEFLDLADVLTENLTINDVTTAILTAWGVDGKNSADDRLKFHQETKLLIVNAPEAEVNSARNLVQLLRNRTREARESASAREIASLKDAFSRAVSEKDRLEHEMQEARAMDRKNQAEAQSRITELEIELSKLQQKKASF